MDYDEHDDSPSCDGSAVTISETVIKYDAQRMFDTIARMAAGAIIEKCGEDIRKAVRESVSEHISAKVSTVVDETLAAGIQQRDRYGDPVGEMTTMKALIGKASEDYLAVKVDKRGEPSSYDSVGTRLHYIVKKNVEEVIDYKMQAEIKKACELAVQQAQMKVAEAVAKLIK
jgi:CRISPR/Cas system-associated exonuclease Cas4 (RecB family)